MKGYATNSFKEIKKLEDARVANKVKCENCGHTMTITFADRMICSGCKRYVYRNEKIKFKYKMLEEMRKKK